MIASLAIYILGFSERIQKDNNIYTQPQDRFLDAVTNSILHYNGHRDLVLISWFSIILSLVLLELSAHRTSTLTVERRKFGLQQGLATHMYM